jgi:hypothetical protein
VVEALEVREACWVLEEDVEEEVVEDRLVGCEVVED